MGMAVELELQMVPDLTSEGGMGIWMGRETGTDQDRVMGMYIHVERDMGTETKQDMVMGMVMGTDMEVGMDLAMDMIGIGTLSVHK